MILNFVQNARIFYPKMIFMKIKILEMAYVRGVKNVG
jgi:hypothetical protein